MARIVIAVSLVLLAPLLHAATAVPAAAGSAQSYPERPIRLIISSSPGTGADYFGRTVAVALTDLYKQQVVADNRIGAGGLIAMQTLANANPDGYTIGTASSSLMVVPLLYAKPPYNTLTDFAPIAMLASIPSVVMVSSTLPAKTVQEFIAYAKPRPGQLNFASVGLGTAAHLSAELFAKAAGIQAVHVPFKNVADAWSEIFAGRVHFIVFVAPAVTPMMREPRLRALAVTSKTRAPGFPDLPTVAEAGLPGAAVETPFGIAAPAKTPRAIINKLHADIVTILKRPETAERFARQGGVPLVDTTPESFAALIKAEYELYRKLIPEIGIKPQ
jgi:tripartite-type tricarboxylate transporter receptor subunit TctC